MKELLRSVECVCVCVLIQLWLTYNVILLSGVQRNDLTLFLRFDFIYLKEKE